MPGRSIPLHGGPCDGRQAHLAIAVAPRVLTVAAHSGGLLRRRRRRVAVYELHGDHYDFLRLSA